MLMSHQLRCTEFKIESKTCLHPAHVWSTSSKVFSAEIAGNNGAVGAASQ